MKMEPIISLESIDGEVQECLELNQIESKLVALEELRQKLDGNDLTVTQNYNTLMADVLDNSGISLVGFNGDQSLTVSGEMLGGLIAKVKHLLMEKRKRIGPADRDGSFFSLTDKQIAEIVERVKRTYLNDEWLSKQTFKQGTTATSGIIEYLVVNKKVPNDILAVHSKNHHDIKIFMTRYIDGLNKHKEGLSKIITEMSNYRGEEALAFIKTKNKALGNPIENHPPVVKGVLGDPILIKTDKTTQVKFNNGFSQPNIPYLNAKTIKNPATAAITMLTDARELLKIIGTTPIWWNIEKSTFSGPFADSLKGLNQNLIYETFDQQDLDKKYFYFLFDYVTAYFNAVIGLDRWIMESFE